ncbi:MAG: amino acid ABC transporter permease [Candidatus Gastranaerophilales bacterium]|nr:amino acid ABC transporter permease [Candidatus Gastranaerophilales bacterium]
MIDFQTIYDNFDFLMKGLQITASLAIVSIVGSLIIGTILGILRYSKIFFISTLATFFIEIIRSIPLILFIIFIHFSISPFLYNNSSFAKIFGLDSLELQTACISLTLFTSAYVAEIIRSGLNSIENGLLDAAKSLGLNYFQRLSNIILPIALGRMMPALVSQFISLTKDTSLASAIGLIELTRAGEIIYERTHKEMEILIFIALIYFIICFSLSLASRQLEKKPFIIANLTKLVSF